MTKLKDCVTEVVEKAKRAMTFVLLQEAACSLPQGFHLQQRRDVVFSQAVSGRSETTRGDPEVQMRFSFALASIAQNMPPTKSFEML